MKSSPPAPRRGYPIGDSGARLAGLQPRAGTAGEPVAIDGRDFSACASVQFGNNATAPVKVRIGGHASNTIDFVKP